MLFCVPCIRQFFKSLLGAWKAGALACRDLVQLEASPIMPVLDEAAYSIFRNGLNSFLSEPRPAVPIPNCNRLSLNWPQVGQDERKKPGEDEAEGDATEGLGAWGHGQSFHGGMVAGSRRPWLRVGGSLRRFRVENP